ncbi:MAG: 2-thiouracil desulfurase family protein [Actinomycetota bacterium]|nr:2-thiouracil desulfurase family protein [Actinomycetota bacterium]
MAREVATGRAKVLVSACLDGSPLRYDGTGGDITGPIWARWAREGRLVAVCPEVAGGLPVPRPRAEITDGTAVAVLGGSGRVSDEHGADVTAAYLRGAEAALAAAERAGARVAVLVEASPSCGSTIVSDGTFTKTKVPGEGVTAALLRRHGIAVFSHQELAGADAHLRDLDHSPAEPRPET